MISNPNLLRISKVFPSSAVSLPRSSSDKNLVLNPVSPDTRPKVNFFLSGKLEEDYPTGMMCGLCQIQALRQAAWCYSLQFFTVR